MFCCYTGGGDGSTDEVKTHGGGGDSGDDNEEATIMADAEQDVQYCVCQQVDSGIMIECVRGTGGCNSWVHPACCGLILTQEELEALDSYICPLCESPSDDFSKMKALNTKLANRQAMKERKRKLKLAEAATVKAKAKDAAPTKKSKRKWTCKHCANENADRDASECSACRLPRKSRAKAASSSSSKKEKRMKPTQQAALRDSDGDSEANDSDRRRSRRDANKQRKSYRVPNSDEDVSSADESGDDDSHRHRHRHSSKHQHHQHRGKKRHRSSQTTAHDDGSGSDDHECDGDDASAKKKRRHKPHEPAPAAVAIAAAPSMVIEKIMGVRKRELVEPAPSGPAPESAVASIFAPRTITTVVTEYFIKWKGFSYLHCSWEARELLLALDPHNNKQRLKRFHEKEHHHQQHQRPFEEGADENDREYFNPEYLEVHRILADRQDAPVVVADAVGTDADAVGTAPDDGVRYLVKWRVLPYTDATWERACDLKDDVAIAKYHQCLVVPPKDAWAPLPRPTLREYRKLDDANIQSRGPFLIVAPLSLIAQWQNECETWTTMNCIVYHGSSDSREVIRDFEFYFPDRASHPTTPRPDKSKPFRFNILVTTYEVAIKDISILAKIKWHCLVVDEAHRLKNQSSRLVEQMRRAFPSVRDFLDKFGDLHDAEQVAELHKMLKPYLLRRVKEDVEKSLPPKEETIIEVELTPVQKQWYRAIYERNTAFLNRGGNPHNVPNLMNVMMELRKCCNHPYLNNGVEDILSDGLVSDAQRHDMMVKCCGKMVLIDKLLPRLKDGGHKVLIFSQMVRVLDIIEDYLRYMGYLYERLDGNIRGNDRQAAVDRFVKPEYSRFASLKLGLDKAVLTHMRRENEDLKGDGKKKSSKAEESKEIDELLKRGAYDVFRDDDTAGEQFCAADIDQILQRSSQVVQYEQQAKSSFSKASFVSATTSDDIDIDDPDFWKKAVGLAEPDPAELADDMPLQRKRTRVNRFGTAGMLDSDGDDEDEAEKKERDADKKERERERDEKERAEEKREPRDWTLNGRDRLQRALMHFGPGRWEIIRSQSGGSRTVDEVEQFAREFIYVLGLSSVESLTSTSKDDSAFIKSVVRASLYAQREKLVNEEEISAVLKDEEFVLKMKQGAARRVLIRLDMLVRLQRLVGASCDKLDAEFDAHRDHDMGEDAAAGGRHDARVPPPSPATSDLDERVAYHGASKVIAALELVSNGERPPWTLITPWWDQEADRHLLVGVFLHGYGRCAQILSDPRLRFAMLEKEAEATAAGASADERGAVKEERRDFEGAMSDGDSDDDASTVNGDVGDDGDAKTQSGAGFGTPAKAGASVSVKKEEYDGDGASAGVASVGAQSKAFKQPEVQHMNRLLFWLLSADEVKKQKEMELYKKERAVTEHQRQLSLEKRQRAAALRRVELKAVQLGQVDVLRQLTVIKNATASPDAVIGQKIKPKEWTKEERRTFAYLVGLYGAPRIRAKSAVAGASTAATSAAAGDSNSTRLRDFAWQTDSVSWMNIVKWGRLNKTAELARQFYETKFLPKCLEVAYMKADPLAADQRAVALADLIGIEFVDAQEGVLAHGLKAKHHAWVTLRRTQLLSDIFEVLARKRADLVAYLRSGRDELVRDMPVWWCPWLHDLAVFEGMARFGIANWEKILLDRTLPFHRDARAAHIRLWFLEGSARVSPLFRPPFDSDAGARAWFDRVVEEFPSLSVLERKVQSVCAEILRDELGLPGRYVEPEYQREFSLPEPHNCLEEAFMASVRCQDTAVDRSALVPQLPSSTETVASREALATSVAESRDRRDEYLQRAIASGDSVIAPRHGASRESSSSATPSSQIAIQMLVS
ncbi:hypothetical protein PybrP1_003545 [[Pythium] brassicae (nom. inval.)]|nr:hypothetical protein PybrP1_003545 [[Pythium] brassicae (nom. inval.)]